MKDCSERRTNFSRFAKYTNNIYNPNIKTLFYNPANVSIQGRHFRMTLRMMTIAPEGNKGNKVDNI